MSFRLQLILTTLFFFALGTTFLAHAAVPQIMHYGNGAEPRELDPATSTGVPEFHIMHNLFEPLVSKDPKTLEPIPGVAESWTISKDRKTYTFKIRKDSKWSNGEPLTAADFIYGWTRLLTPATASEYAQQGYYFKNGKDFHLGKLKDASQLGFKAKDPYTLEVTLESPTPFFLGLLYHHSLYAVHKATVEKHGARWTRPENIVSNGAFILTRWEMNKVITLKPNPHYWDRKTVKLEEVHFYPTENAATEEKQFRAGELHVTETMPLEKIPTWQADKSGAYQQYPYLCVYHYWLNTTKPPFNNKLVRKAMALAIDREKIVKFVTRGGQMPAQYFVPPGAGGYQPKALLPKDLSRVEEAKKLLAEAGFPGGKGLPPIEILYNTQEGHKKIAEAVQAMLKQNLGIDVRLFNQEWKVYLDNQRTKNYQMSRAAWAGDYNDPNTFLDQFVSGSGLNHAGYNNPKYDELIAKAGQEVNEKKRLALFAQAEAMLLDDVPTIPIYIYTRTYLKSPKVQGWYPNVESIHPLKWVSLK